MKKQFTLLTIITLVMFGFLSFGQTSELIISEYVEGSSGNNKYIEIYNGTGSSVDLTNYDLAVYANGASTPNNTIDLTGSIANDAVIVVAHTDADLWGGTPDISSANLTFNGNDVVSLRKSSSNIDVIGTIGSSDDFAKDTRLIRKATIGDPNTVYTIDEWESGSDAYDNLGSHTFTGAGPDETAPSFATGYPKSSNITTTSFDVLVKINELGTVYYLKLANDATAPTIAEVKAGTAIAVTDATQEYSASFSGLEIDTPYDIYFVAEDDEATPNVQDAVTKFEVSTISDEIPTATDLFFSEYIEGSGNNKVLEIYNGTESAISLEDYRIKIIHNGDFEDEYFNFPAVNIASNDVYVIANIDASISAIIDQADTLVAYATNTIVSFNGNDARFLEKSTDATWSIIDVIGTSGTEDYFAVAGVENASVDHTLVRKLSVTEGNTNWTTAAGTGTDDSEWIVYNIDKVDFIGYHGLNSENDIKTFTLDELTEDAVINATDHTVTAIVGAGTVLTALNPTITVSVGAQVSPSTPQDFTTSVVYTVTAQNGDAQDWTTTITVAEVNDEANITSFVLDEQTGDAVINSTDHTIAIEVAAGTVVTSLKPTIELSYGATVTPDTAVAQDFSSAVTYTVTAEDETTNQAWVVTVTVQVIDLVSIYDIQYSTAANFASPYDSERVMVTGIVTAMVPGKGFFLQDSAAAWNGIYVYTPTGDVGVIGDSVVFTAQVTEYFELTELSYVEDYVVASQGNVSPESVVITAGEVVEPYEGVIVSVENATCVNVNFDDHDNSLYVVDGSTDTLMVHDLIYEFTPVLNTTYTFTGIVNYDFSNFKVEPRDSNDVEVLNVVNNPPVIDNIVISPENPVTATAIEILADITDDVLVTAKSFMYGFYADSINIALDLTEVGFAGIRFKATIPALTEAGKVYYKFSASDIETTVYYTDSITVVLAGVEDINAMNNVAVYPNPFNNELTISNIATVTEIKIVNMIGKEIFSQSNSLNNQIQINLANLETGIYFVVLIDENQNKYAKRIVKQ